jgi:hypothetical protein
MIHEKLTFPSLAGAGDLFVFRGDNMAKAAARFCANGESGTGA